jgi:peptide/nickel transport system ATP-binding protein
MAEGQALLQVDNLFVDYYTLEGIVHAVRGITFNIKQGESVCLVGESGSGKSTVGAAIAMALPNNARAKGRIEYAGKNLVAISEKERVELAGREISIIFQDPAASLNPLFTIGEQMSDIISHHLGLRDREDALRRAAGMLKKAGLPDPERILNSYPHQLSGGMLQRVNIAIALSTNPKLLVADEPTTMLDVTLQAQILELLRNLQQEMSLSMLFITHNLGVAAEVCDRIIVMYAGVIFEEGPTDSVLLNPLHPYTIRLLQCVPRAQIKVEKLSYIPGSLPDPRFIPPGCPFADRCDEKTDECIKKMPPMIEVRPSHRVACFKYLKR